MHPKCIISHAVQLITLVLSAVLLDPSSQGLGRAPILVVAGGRTSWRSFYRMVFPVSYESHRLQIYLLDLAGIQEAYVAFNMMTEIGSLPAIETYNSPYAKVGSSRRQRPSILG